MLSNLEIIYMRWYESLMYKTNSPKTWKKTKIKNKATFAIMKLQGSKKWTQYTHDCSVN